MGFELGDVFAGVADGLNERGLGGRLGVEADQQNAGRESEFAGGDRGDKQLGQLSLGEVAIAGATALELRGPAAEGLSVEVAFVIAQAPAASIGVQQQPGIRGGLSERVGGLEAGGVGVGRDEVAPQSTLLGRAKQQVGGAAVEQQAVPLAIEPRVPGQDLRRLPVSEIESALAEIEVAAQGAGGTLVGGENGPVAREGLFDLGRQRAVGGHTPFIRLAVAEKAEHTDRAV